MSNLPDKREGLQPTPCSWCTRDTTRGVGVWLEKKHKLTAGGVFEDVDWGGFDLEGIPVCGGCGGLGVQYSTPNFAEKTEQIQALRFEFADAVYELHDPQKQLKILIELERAVKDLVKIYGHGKENSLAHAITEGLLEGRIKHLKSLN